MNTLQVTVDKSHLVTIGEKLYAESVELVRELVNNAYDADATHVEVMIAEDKIGGCKGRWLFIQCSISKGGEYDSR